MPPPAPKDSLRIYKLCVVCLGNICRSPIAEAVIRAELASVGLAGRVSVESAGTGDWHLGEPMDRQARAELTRRGYDGSAHRARQINADWLDQFDLVIAMDASNLRNLQRMAAGRADIIDRKISGLDFLASVCKILGIDYTKQNQTPVGRPIRIVDKEAKLIEELL